MDGKTTTREGFEVTIRHLDDESPDLSYMGEYSGKVPAFPYWDRALEAIIHDEDEADKLWDEDKAEGWTYRREHRYIGGFQKAADDRETWDAAILQDVARLESYNRGDWCSVGVEATASREGVILGRSSIWGIESDAGSYFDEVEEDQTLEAIAEAKEKLSKLCKG